MSERRIPTSEEASEALEALMCGTERATQLVLRAERGTPPPIPTGGSRLR